MVGRDTLRLESAKTLIRDGLNACEVGREGHICWGFNLVVLQLLQARVVVLSVEVLDLV